VDVNGAMVLSAWSPLNNIYSMFDVGKLLGYSF